MSVKVVPRVLKGFRDFLPEQQAVRATVLDLISNAFELCAFVPISTPAVEYLDVLTGKYGDEGDKLLYHFKDHGERDVALRYDLTVPLARVVAMHRDLPTPFKRYQVGTVWRAEKPAHGRFREFVQCDADIVGTSSPIADADCIAAGIGALRALGIEGFKVKISHRGVLNALMAKHGIIDTSAQTGTLRTLDKMDKVGIDKVHGMLSEQDGVGPGPARSLLGALAELKGNAAAVAGRLARDLTDDAGPAVGHLAGVIEALDAMGLSAFAALDLSIARGLDYYTGTVFETTLDELPSVGSVMSGGRYDSLLDVFGMKDVPAVGISIGVDRLIFALSELGTGPEAACGPAAVCCPIGDDAVRFLLGLLPALRAAGVPCEMVPRTSWRMKKQLQYAARGGARFALIAGDDEVAGGKVNVKDLASGEQSLVDGDDVVATVSKSIERGKPGG